MNTKEQLIVIMFLRRSFEWDKFLLDALLSLFFGLIRKELRYAALIIRFWC